MWTILYDIIIYPIEFLVELMYVFFMKALGVEGLAIIGISVAVNLLTLPLYHAAEQLQKVERDQRIALAPGIARIKAAFKGDERYMILSTFYRQNHYHPMYALRNSLSLLIQVPFFIAAYHFLSHLDALNGVSFLFIHPEFPVFCTYSRLRTIKTTRYPYNYFLLLELILFIRLDFTFSYMYNIIHI